MVGSIKEVPNLNPFGDIRGERRKHRSGYNVCTRLPLRPQEFIQPCRFRNLIIVNERYEIDRSGLANRSVPSMGDSTPRLNDVLYRPPLGNRPTNIGGRATCIVAALWPERVRCLLTCNGYNMQDIARSHLPAAPEQEHRFWYQYYFHTERGRAGLTANRRDFCRLIWRLWSPNWQFDDATFERSAISFDNPDFVDVTIQSYRHRFRYAEGDPALEPIEQRLAARPTIAAPTINLHGEVNGVGPPETSASHARFFTGPYQRRVIPRAGHNLPQEVPGIVTEATLELIKATA